MGMTDRQMEIARAKAKKPLENVKPKVGMTVQVRDEPGLWVIVGKAPTGADWWLSPGNDAARAAEKKPAPLGSYREAGYRDMRPHNHKGGFE